MKILYTVYTLSFMGGIERILTEKANYLVEFYDVTIVTCHDTGPCPYPIESAVKRIDLNIDYERLQGLPLFTRAAAYRRLQRQHRAALQKTVDAVSPDVIVCLGGHDTALVPRLITNAKTVWESHFCKRYVSCALKFAQAPFFEKTAQLLKAFLNNRATERYDRMVVLTEEDRRDWRRKNAVVIPNFITANICRVSPLTAKTAVTAGRLVAQKGYDMLIAVWKIVNARLPDWTLEIYGEGPERERLQRQIDDAGLHNAALLKGAARTIGEVYTSASLFLSSSRFEGMPLVMIEAMAAGLPVVSFDYSCGPKDLLQNNAGCIVPPGDCAAFARAVIALAENAEVRRAMGERARQESARYTKEAVMQKWRAFFDGLSGA